VADGIYVGMSAAAARAAQLESISDNLANVETPGFKAGRPSFQSFLPGRGTTDKVFTAAVATGTDVSPGTTVTTDNPLDVIPDGDLYLGVQTPQGIAYTRNGKISVNPDGHLSVAGHPLLGRSGDPIVVPEGVPPTIDSEGNVIVGGASVDRLALFQVQGPVDRVGLTLLGASAGTTVQPVDEGGTVRVGELEMGNVQPLECTVAMITAQRNFESAMQAIQTYRQLDQRATEVGRVR
jgi:flagellar basal-body rod protein FlgF